jgi:hypothetical protein
LLTHFNAYVALAAGLWRTRSAANAAGVVFCAAFAFVSLAFGVLLERAFRVPLWAARPAMRGRRQPRSNMAAANRPKMAEWFPRAEAFRIDAVSKHGDKTA